MLSDVSVIRLMWVAFLPKPVKKVKVLKKKKEGISSESRYATF